MGSYERPTAAYYLTAVGLEGIRGVIEFDAEEELKKLICQSIDDKFDYGIVDNPATLDKAASEDTIITLV
jgi:hypothetical protein